MNRPRSLKLQVAALLLLALLSLLPLPLLALPYGNLDWIVFDPAYQQGCSYPSPSSGPLPTEPPPPAPAAPAPPCAELPAPGEPLAARVNGQEIGLGALEREVGQYQQALEATGTDLNSPEAQAALPQIRREVLELMIQDVLIQQAAVELGIGLAEGALEVAIADQVEAGGGLEPFEAWLEETGQTWDEFRLAVCQDLLRAALAGQVTAEITGTMEMVQARQIVLPDEEQAVAVLARLASGQEFGEIAREVSIDPATRERGGELGWFPRGLGAAAPAVEDAAFAGQPGQVQGPIPVEQGYAIVQTVDPPTAQTLAPETREALRARVFENWLAGLRQAAAVEILVDLDDNPQTSSPGLCRGS